MLRLFLDTHTFPWGESVRYRLSSRPVDPEYS